MKHARRDANYAILTKLVKLQDEKKPVSNLLSMKSAGFEQTFTEFIASSDVFLNSCSSPSSWTVSTKCIYEIYKGREMHRHYAQADTLLSICYC